MSEHPVRNLTNDEFTQKAKQLVLDYVNEHLDKSDGYKAQPDDVFIVWSCYILRNQKMLLSTTLPDGMYYEVTYDANRHAIYFDAYKKFENRCIETI